MSSITIPAEAVGRVGMIAALGRVSDTDTGRIVVLRDPVGFVTDLVGSKVPVFAWLALSLGEPITCNGKPSRNVYVADNCLRPIASMSRDEAEKMARVLTNEDVQQAKDDLAQSIQANDISEQEFDELLEKAAHQFMIEHALQNVAVPIALKEMGFVDSNVTGTFFWVGIHGGMELRIDAAEDWCGRWVLLATGNSPRQSFCHERIIPGEGLRGKIFLEVLRLWRNAFGNEMVPDCLSLGEIYERHAATMHLLNPGGPALEVDARVFRATMKWLRQRQDDLFDGEGNLTLTFADGLLRLSVGRVSYGCPARGSWAEECQVKLADMLEIPVDALKRKQIRMERRQQFVEVNGYKFRVV